MIIQTTKTQSWWPIIIKKEEEELIPIIDKYVFGFDSDELENIIGDQSEKISKKLNLKEEKQIYWPSTSIAKIAQEMPIERSPPKPFYISTGIYGASDDFNSKYTSWVQKNWPTYIWFVCLNILVGQQSIMESF